MKSPSNKRAILIISILSVLVAVTWGFPVVWYNKPDANLKPFWLAEQTNMVGWIYEAVPVGKTAERSLVADRLMNGEFRRSGADPIRVFSAKRYSETSNEIGLFVHTPDRCWTEGGWKIHPAAPDVVAVNVHGTPLILERRIFWLGDQRELVYFGGLVAGQPLPYRLDHNMSVGMRHALGGSREKTGTALRSVDNRLWTRVWESFAARRPLIGPKQFIRISTPISEANPDAADESLKQFVNQWLLPTDYQTEIASWKTGGEK